MGLEDGDRERADELEESDDEARDSSPLRFSNPRRNSAHDAPLGSLWSSVCSSVEDSGDELPTNAFRALHTLRKSSSGSVCKAAAAGCSPWIARKL